MKSAAECAVLSLVAMAAGLGHWLVDGRPAGDPVERFVEQQSAEPRPLKEDEVRLEDVENRLGVLWMDARKPDRWREDGLPGSINVTTLSDEDLVTQLARYQNELFGANLLVIYCDDVDCSLSHDLMKVLVRDFADLLPPEVLVLHGGHVALRAAGRID